MITMGIGLVAGVFYWLASYKLAFWILIYATVYGALGILRGDDHARPIYRGDSSLLSRYSCLSPGTSAGWPAIFEVSPLEMPCKKLVRSSVT